MSHEFTAPGFRPFDDDEAEAPAVDVDLDQLRGAAPTDLDSELDAIRAELTATVTAPTVIPVPSRAGYAVEFRTDFIQRDLEGLRKQAKSKLYAGGLDVTRFNALLLAFTCRSIRRNGAALDLGSGPVTFASREFQELMGADRAATAVLKFYGLEGHVDATANRLIAEAGWGENIEAVTGDPQ